MQIIIPTRGRTDQQLTLEKLPRELRKRTWLVCPKREASGLYRLHKNIVVEPHPMKLAEKRGWIVQEWFRCGYEKVLMLDDDLIFRTRISADDWPLRTIWGEELIPEFQRIEEKLGPDFPHVGFGQAQGNNHETAGWKLGKMVCALSYYLPIVAKECRWDLVELRQDMCATLQLLLKGYPNAVWTGTVVDQGRGRDAPGGCSIYRTDEMSAAEAEKLATLFPGYVSVVEKDYKGSRPRKEVRCEWQKALDDGRKKNSGHR